MMQLVYFCGQKIKKVLEIFFSRLIEFEYLIIIKHSVCLMRGFLDTETQKKPSFTGTPILTVFPHLKNNLKLEDFWNICFSFICSRAFRGESSLMSKM